jgi:hypothetical protein
MARNLQVENAVSATAQPVKDQQGNTSSLTLSTDRVGIGTTAPKTRLQVAGDIIAGNDVNGQKFIFHTRTNGEGDGDFLHIAGDDANGNWQFDKGIVFQRGSGNVGIGAHPKAALQVAGDIIAGSDVNGQKFIFHTRTNGEGDFLHITGDDVNGNWQFDKGVAFVRATGNVGIGTTAPGEKLVVNGNIVVTGP